MKTAVVKNIISCLVFPIKIIDKFSVSILYEILEQKKVKGSSSKANKDCQILLFDVHVVHRTPKVSFPRRISEDDGEQVASSLHSSVQLLYSGNGDCSLPSSHLKGPHYQKLRNHIVFTNSRISKEFVEI